MKSKDKTTRNRKTSANSTPSPVIDAREKLIDLFDIPAAAFSGMSQMEISGNREAVIDGCQGVLAYDENMIKLACGKLVMTFFGRNLQIRTLTHDSAVVTGYITSIEFTA